MTGLHRSPPLCVAKLSFRFGFSPQPCAKFYSLPIERLVTFVPLFGFIGKESGAKKKL